MPHHHTPPHHAPLLPLHLDVMLAQLRLQLQGSAPGADPLARRDPSVDRTTQDDLPWGGATGDRDAEGGEWEGGRNGEKGDSLT